MRERQACFNAILYVISTQVIRISGLQGTGVREVPAQPAQMYTTFLFLRYALCAVCLYGSVMPAPAADTKQLEHKPSTYHPQITQITFNQFAQL